MIKLQGATILDALACIERGDRTSQHVRRDAKPPWTDHELEVDPGSRPERTRPLDEGAARAQVDERHGVAGPEDRLRARDHRLAETRVGPTVC